MTPKAFVSGCFDTLHSGHIEFFMKASAYGDLYVAIGSDKSVCEIKGRVPINNEQERLFMIQAVSCVKQAFISKGSGELDFEQELREIHPDFFIVNEEGNVPEKRKLCKELGIQHIVLSRTPHASLPPRSTTDIHPRPLIPYRIDLAGGWLDQPWVSEHFPGPVITISLEATIEFNDRSGMASSTRRSAIDLWGTRIPPGNYEQLAKTLFCYDNPPGTKIISGSQDSIGIVFPGLARADFEGRYWPTRIQHVQDPQTLRFVENSLYLLTLGPRRAEFDVLANTRIDRAGARALAEAAEKCWRAILAQDIQEFGRSFRKSFEAQIAMFPNMMNDSISDLIKQYQEKVLGWKISGAGGGGYLILVSDTPIENAVRVIARRETE